jgi:hypothetical protein
VWIAWARVSARTDATQHRPQNHIDAAAYELMARFTRGQLCSERFTVHDASGASQAI